MAVESKPIGNYLVNKTELPQLISSLEGISIREVHSERRKDVVYFDNEKHELYFGQNVRAKRYSNSAPRSNFQIFQQRDWILEQKGEFHAKNAVRKHTQPGRFTFAEIAEWLIEQREFNNNHLLAPLVPFVANSYEHMEFLVNGDRQFKMVVDNRTQHFAFMDISAAMQVGQEDFARIKLKMYYNPNNYNYDVARMFKRILSSVGAVPVVSKMDAVYNLLGMRLMQESGLQPRQTDTEIEAKLSLEAKNQHLFNLIKNDFAEGRVKGFKLLERFPHMLESAKISTYLIMGGEYVRVSSNGNTRVVTTKEGKEIMGDPQGLGCILRRKEIESNSFPDLQGKETVNIYKKMKHFMVTGTSGSEYSISMDGCFRMDGKSGSLYQIEIESTLMQPSKGQEADATSEISDITKQLIDMHIGLTPTTLTKQEWVSSSK